MTKQTPLFQLHQEAKAELIDFAGWQMPAHYGSPISEHHSVRKKVGMFDVSHMGIVDISGNQAIPFLRLLLANDIKRLNKDGKALYSCLLNEEAGIIDDLIVYRLEENLYRIVCNAACFDKDIRWIQKNIPQDINLQIQPRPDLAIIALQGPSTFELLKEILPLPEVNSIKQLPAFEAFNSDGKLYARTGYTGEEGVELIVPHKDAIDLWQKLYQKKVQPCGLIARDTLRLEAGLNLYGRDMDETTTPIESNLDWTVDWKDGQRNFVGRTALLKKIEQGVNQKLVGLILQTPGVLRENQKVITEEGEGRLTSGIFSPTLNKGIALARIPVKARPPFEVERKGQKLPVVCVKPPFVRKGKSAYKLLEDKKETQE